MTPRQKADKHRGEISAKRKKRSHKIKLLEVAKKLHLKKLFNK